MKKKFAGFTLTEVLITLFILGIVAAVTIVTLRNVIPEDYTYTSKKASVTLSEGVKTMLDDDRKYAQKEFVGGEQFCRNYTGLFKTGGTIDCGQNVVINDLEREAAAGIPRDSELYNRANLTTTNNEVWWGLTQRFNGDEPIRVLTDVNGPNKGRNILGEDIVALDLYKNGKIGIHEVEDTNRTPDRDPALGTCTLIGSIVSRENISDIPANEQHNVSHRLCIQERVRCEKDGEVTETTRPEVCIECPDVEDRKVLVNNNGVISIDPIANMALTNRAGIEYRRTCPNTIGGGAIDIGSLRYEDGTPVRNLTLNETLNPIGGAVVGAKEQHVNGYYGRAHIEKLDTLQIRQRAVLVNQKVYEKGLSVSNEISGLTPAQMLLWSDRTPSNVINDSLSIAKGNDCGNVNTTIFKKANRGAAVRMQDAGALKLLLGTANKQSKEYINLGCGYLHQCQQIERDGSGTAFDKYKEFDMPYVFGSRADGLNTSCEKCAQPTRSILKVTMTDPNNTDYTCKSGDQYGDCPNDWTDTKYKKQCTQYRRSCSPLTVNGATYNFSSNFPGGNMGGDANMNLGSSFIYDGGKTGCKACTLSEQYFLKENKNSKSSVSDNNTDASGHTFKYMTACTQISRKCEDSSLNQDFKTDKSENLLGCSSCYSEHVLTDIVTAQCERVRVCDAADKNGTGKGDEEYNKYSRFNTGKVKYDCACELLSSSTLSATSENRFPFNFRYCSIEHSKGTCPSGTEEGNEKTKQFTIKVPETHIKQAEEKMYRYLWEKDLSNNMVNNDQKLEYKDGYKPEDGKWTSLPYMEEKIKPYFIFQGCDAGKDFVCNFVSYDQDKQEFTVEVTGQETCAEKCNDHGTSCGNSLGGFCNSCCDRVEYACPTEKDPTRTCKRCVKYKNNNSCMTYKLKNDRISKITVDYRYPSPLCPNKLDPVPEEIPDPVDRCGKCTIQEHCGTDENYKQLVCENTDCNGEKSIICCPATPETVNLTENGVEFAVGNCGGENTGVDSDIVNKSECLAEFTDQKGTKSFYVPEAGDGIEYANAKLTLDVIGIQGDSMYIFKTKRPALSIDYPGYPAGGWYEQAGNGTRTFDLPGFKGGTVVIGMSAGNYCGEGTTMSWTCSSSCGNRCGSSNDPYRVTDGSRSCCQGCGPICPNATAEQNKAIAGVRGMDGLSEMLS